MTFDDVLAFSRTGGLIYFLLLFLAVLIYALWPSNKQKFERAARLPLDEE